MSFLKGNRINNGRIPWNKGNKKPPKQYKLYCLKCGKVFYRHWERYKFCSRDCFKKAMKGKHHSPETEFKTKPKVPTICQMCGKHFIPDRRGRKFCSISCAGKHTGKLSKGRAKPNRKELKKKSDGYVYIRIDSHPCQTSDGFVKRCILVMEKKIGRKLDKEERVHHVNRIKNDDRMSNLRLFINETEHQKYHNKFRERDNLGRYLCCGLKN